MTRLPSRLPPGIRRLFRLPATRDRMLREMDEEIATHVGMRIEWLRARGMSEAEAQAEALRRFGDSDEFRRYSSRRVARRSRWLTVGAWIADWAQDVRFALRQIAKAPAVIALVVLTLALAIGANTAIFTVVHRLLLDPLPYPNGDRIVVPMQDDGRGGLRPVDGPLFAAWHERARAVDAIASAWDVTFGVRDDGTIEHVPNGGMTPNYLNVLGVAPALGRTFTAEEAQQKAPGVAMISYTRWQRDFGGRPDVLGSTLELEGKRYTVIGVTPRGLTIPFSTKPTPEIWLPARLGGGCCVIATLRTGTTTEAATNELRAIAETVPMPGAAGGESAESRIMRAQDFLDTRTTRSVEVLFVAVGALLIIACANVASLLLARAWNRRREFAVRTALGAGRGRLTRQVLTESVLLSLAGGALGVVLASQMLRIILVLRPLTLVQLDDVRLAPAVLLWSVCLSIATGILFGSFPAILARTRKAGDVLRAESRLGSPGVTARRVRSALIVGEIAMAIVLLIGAGLLIRSFRELQRMRLGFEPHGLVSVTIITGPHNRGREEALRDAVIDRLRAVPGAREVTIGTMPGQGWGRGGAGLEAEPMDGGAPIRVSTQGINFVFPDYFRVTRIALVEGRLPDLATIDQPRATPFGWSTEVVINRALARRLRPNGVVIGSRLRPTVDEGFLPPGMARDERWSIVVGIVDDVRMPGFQGDFRELQLYALLPPRLSNIPFIVRMAGSGEDAMLDLERAVKADPTVLFYGSQSGEAYLRESLAPTKFAMALLTAFAVVAFVLASVGLYGVIAYGVTQRSREIGVRVALGADRGAITRLVIADGMRLAALGVGVGIILAVAATRMLESMLYGVAPSDPITFVLVSVLVGSIAIVGSYAPARRALRVDPTEALRGD